VNVQGLKHIFDKVIEETRALLDCKVLIDLQDSTFQLFASDVIELIDGIDSEGWPYNNKVALVSPAEIRQYQQLAMLGEGLMNRSLKVAVFGDTKEAISWLSGIKTEPVAPYTNLLLPDSVFPDNKVNLAENVR